MTLEEMAQRRQSTESSENSTSEKQTDVLTKLNEENRKLSEQNKTLAAKITTLTKKNTSLTKTIDQQEETIRAMNVKLLFPPKPKVEYRERLYQKCKDCDVREVKKELEETELFAVKNFIFTALFMLLAALKNTFIRRDICTLAVSFSRIVCKCGGKIHLVLTKAAHTANSITDPTAAKIVGGLIYILWAIIIAAIIIAVLWLLSYTLVHLVNKYWKDIYSELCIISAAVVILFFDAPIFSECINTILIFFVLTGILTVIYEILRFKGVINYE